MSKEYKVEQSNGIWYVWQFDICKRMTAHAKLDTIRQLALWIEEQENYDEHNGMDHASDNDMSSTDIVSYCYNSGHVVP